MPPGEHPIGQLDEPFPDGGPAVLSVDHRLEIPTQVGPAKLPAAEPVVSLPAVRSDHLAVSGTEQLLCDFAAAGGGDVEDRHKGRDHDPKPGPPPGLTPGGLVHVG